MSELKTTPPRIAIPVPHSGDREYAERALPQYEEAVRGAGGEPVRIELDQTPVQVMKQMSIRRSTAWIDTRRRHPLTPNES